MSANPITSVIVRLCSLIGDGKSVVPNDVGPFLLKGYLAMGGLSSEAPRANLSRVSAYKAGHVYLESANLKKNRAGFMSMQLEPVRMCLIWDFVHFNCNRLA